MRRMMSDRFFQVNVIGNVVSTKCRYYIIVDTRFRFFTYNNIVKMVRDMVPGGYVGCLKKKDFYNNWT